MSKRRNNDGHLSREEYEALQRRDDGDGDGDENTGGGPRRATREVLAKRKILSVSKKWKQKSERNTSAAKEPSSKKLSFAPMQLPTSTSKSPAALGGGGGGNLFARPVPAPSAGTPKSNPFASVSFATTPANKSNNNAKGKLPFATSTKKQRPNLFSTTVAAATTTITPTVNTTGTFSFSPQGNAVSTPIVAASIMDMNKNNEGNKKLSTQKLLKIAMLRMTQKEFKHNPLSDWSAPWMKNFVDKMEEYEGIDDDDDKNDNSNNDNQEALDKQPETKATTSTFSFASPSTTAAPAAAKPTFSFKPAEPTTATATATAEPKLFTGFNFGNAPKTTQPSTFGTQQPSQDDANDTNQKEEKTEVLPDINEDEEELFSCRAKYLKMVDKEWKVYPAGVCRLFRNKKNSKMCKVVIRDQVGRIRLNIPVAHGVKFTRVTQKGAGMISFMSKEDENAEPALFSIKCKMDYFDKLCSTLEDMAA